MPTPTMASERPLLILQTGRPVPSMRRYGGFAHWIRVAAGLARDQVAVVDVEGGAALPPIDAVQAAIVTGSGAMVTDRADWSERSAAWLRDAAHAGRPLLGICYGHQLIAHALGGEVGANPRGREMGTVEIETLAAASDDPLFRGLPTRFAAQATHLQSALALPTGAVPLARSALEPHHAFRWGERVWGLQFHPEFSATHMRGYIRARAQPLREEAADPAAMLAAVRAAPHARTVLRRFAAACGRTSRPKAG